MNRLKPLPLLLIATICFFCQSELTAKEFNLQEFKSKLPSLLGANNAGTDFWLTFNPIWESAGVVFNEVFYISSAYETTVTVEIPGKTYHKQLKTVPNDIIEFKLTPSLGQCYRKTDRMIPEPDQVYSGYGIHVSAPLPIIVYGVTRYLSMCYSYLALPVSSLGKDYIVATWPDISDNGIQYLPGVIQQ